MRYAKFATPILLLCQVPLANGADVQVIISSDVRPGVYGRVDFGSAPPPPVVYTKPVVIVQEPRRPAPVQPMQPMQPVYLHVPPGHAKHWSKHCSKYNACSQSVYFVRSDEYKPKKHKKEKKDKHD